VGAARDLGLPTSTVSRAITRLEGALGLLLVQRSPRGFLVTDAGKEYLHSWPKDSSWRVRNYPGTKRGIFASRPYLARAGTPTEPSQLSSHRCIGAGIWRLTRGTKIVIPEIAFQVVGSDPGVHLELALKGVGIAVLPLWMARRPEMERVLAPVLPSWHPDPITLCALYTGTARFTPKVKVFLDFIDNYIGTSRDPRLSTNKPKDLFTDLHATTAPARAIPE
jgi:LysR family transcriptional regulator, transcriptional activator for dmlA